MVRPQNVLICRYLRLLVSNPKFLSAYRSGAPEFTLSFSEVRVARSLVFSVMFCRLLFVLCSSSFRHCVVCPSQIYDFWLPLWYLQTFLIKQLLNVITDLVAQIIHLQRTGLGVMVFNATFNNISHHHERNSNSKRQW